MGTPAMSEPVMVRLAIAAIQRKHRDEEWKQLVKEAAANHSLRDVGRIAGVSHARVAQIVKEQ